MIPLDMPSEYPSDRRNDCVCCVGDSVFADALPSLFEVEKRRRYIAFRLGAEYEYADSLGDDIIEDGDGNFINFGCDIIGNGESSS